MGKTVLVTGGSGYLGQHLIHALQSEYKVLYTYNRQPLRNVPDHVSGYQVDFVSGNGLHEAFSGGVDAVINCAAVSQPALCEKDPAVARAINVPDKLLDALSQQQQTTGKEALLIHISTDQVYDGSKAMWAEGDACEPVNAYGRSKLEAERAVAARWPRHVILRSSIIYGPLTCDHIDRTLFIQFIDSALAKGQATSFFTDEWRCPVAVSDIVAICRRLLQAEQLPPHKVYNMGGPERLSRVHMAQAVAAVRGHDPALILPVPSASVSRPVASPADISMDISRLQQDLGLRMTPLKEALQAVFAQ